MNRFDVVVLTAASSLAFCGNAGAQLGDIDRDTLTQVVAELSPRSTAPAQSMPRPTRAEYIAAMDRADLDFRAARQACNALRGNAKDICMAEARGAERVAKAESEARVKGTHKSRYDVRIARADADFGVAKEKCDDKAGNDRKVCHKEAKAAHVNATVDARSTLAAAEARSIAARF